MFERVKKFFNTKDTNTDEPRPTQKYPDAEQMLESINEQCKTLGVVARVRNNNVSLAIMSEVSFDTLMSTLREITEKTDQYLNETIDAASYIAYINKILNTSAIITENYSETEADSNENC